MKCSRPLCWSTSATPTRSSTPSIACSLLRPASRCACRRRGRTRASSIRRTIPCRPKLWRQILSGYFRSVRATGEGVRHRDHKPLAAVLHFCVKVLRMTEFAQTWLIHCERPLPSTHRAYIPWWLESGTGATHACSFGLTRDCRGTEVRYGARAPTPAGRPSVAPRRGHQTVARRQDRCRARDPFHSDEWQRLPMPFDEVRLLTPRPLPAGLIPPHPKFREVVVGQDVPGLLWEQVVLPARVRDLDVFLAPSDTMPVVALWKRVVMMYAYSPEMAASFPWSSRIRWEPFARNAARHGDAIIVSSRNILETLEQGLRVQVPRERVHYAPLAADARFHPRAANDPAHGRARQIWRGGLSVHPVRRQAFAAQAHSRAARRVPRGQRGGAPPAAAGRTETCSSST